MRAGRKTAATDSKARRRRPQAGRVQFFALVAELFYNPSASLEQLSRNLDLSPSAIKRALWHLRRDEVILGRLGSLRLSLAALPKVSDAFCRAVICAESDIQRLKSLRRSRASRPYRTEQELLQWLFADLPRNPPYKGQVIVETAYIVMGAPEFSLMLTVHAVSNEVLFGFATHGVEWAYGVTRTQTLMIAQSIA